MMGGTAVQRGRRITEVMINGGFAKDLAAEFGIGRPRVWQILRQYQSKCIIAALREGVPIPDGIVMNGYGATAIKRYPEFWQQAMDAIDMASRRRQMQNATWPNNYLSSALLCIHSECSREEPPHGR